MIDPGTAEEKAKAAKVISCVWYLITMAGWYIRCANKPEPIAGKRVEIEQEILDTLNEISK